MQSIRYCDSDGYFGGVACPVCDRTGEAVLSGSQRETLSRFLSYALRHNPEDAGIEVDDAGWTDADELVTAAQDEYNWVNRRDVAAVISVDPKGRYEVDGNQVRAVYGHSIDVEIDVDGGDVPSTLYHGTDPEKLDAIMDEGLQPMNRNKVHLTDDTTEARTVGERHARDPVLLRIDAEAMIANGFTIRPRANHVYTTETVPPRYIEVDEPN